MFGLPRISEHARAVIWLWENDRTNWRIGSHANVHQPTGIGVWTANADYGLSLAYDIPDRDRPNAHSCNGRKVELKKRDRKAIYRIVVRGQSLASEREICRQVSDWATEKIENRVPGETHLAHLSR